MSFTVNPTLQDAAAAALFTACKIEDTLKKSREVLCAAWNLRLPSSDHLSPDDPVSSNKIEEKMTTLTSMQVFEQPSKTVVGLERLMLESAGFDFRNRHPQEIVLKLVKDLNLPKETIGRLAYNMSIDIYRTFAPLKQTAQTMAIACVELAARLLNLTANFDLDSIVGPQGISLEKWSTTRAEIMGIFLASSSLDTILTDSQRLCSICWTCSHTIATPRLSVATSPSTTSSPHASLLTRRHHLKTSLATPSG